MGEGFPSPRGLLFFSAFRRFYKLWFIHVEYSWNDCHCKQARREHDDSYKNSDEPKNNKLREAQNKEAKSYGKRVRDESMTALTECFSCNDIQIICFCTLFGISS